MRRWRGYTWVPCRCQSIESLKMKSIRKNELHRPRMMTFLVLASICVYGCSEPIDEGGVRGVTDDTIVIGSWAPLTGPAALWGAVGRGAEAYFEMINEQGGIHGRQIEFVLRDDAYQPSRTVAAVREMVERDRVFAFVAGVGTAPGRAVVDYIMENEVVWVSPATGATHWAYPPRKYLFAQYTPYFDEAAVLVDYVVNELGKTRIGVIYQNDDFGESGLVGAQVALEKYGLNVVEAVSVEVSDTDLSSHAIRLRESGAEAILMWLTPRHATIIVGAVGRLGHEPQWLASSVLADTELMYDLTEGAWEGVIFAAIGELANSAHPLIEQYREASARIAPEERASEFFLSGFRYAEPLVEGLRRAGRDLTTESLVVALESLDGFQGIGAPLTYTTNRRQGTRATFLARTIDGEHAERLTDWLESGVDIEQVIRRLEGSN
ncbi:MAG TPA: ABC transporter substrate-binding protein [Gemmatimonadetes bacterium]|nr:ABC transporter substrate-binding protein [Gemmatimonadota bacterium]